jgi:hypothetical protein
VTGTSYELGRWALGAGGGSYKRLAGMLSTTPTFIFYESKTQELTTLK